jgi:hemolysin III
MATMTLDGFTPSKPRLRGVLHQWAAMAALAAGAVLTAMAPNGRAAVGSSVFAVSLVALFTVSATYHRPTWGALGRRWMRRLDHSAIFLLIAGTYTPLCLLALEPQEGTRLLAVVWAAAGLGILQSVAWIDAPKVVTALLAVLVGWSVVPWFGAVYRALSGLELALMVAGGILYTAGAVSYASKRPNPKPGVFGYHEVFHALTIAAGVLHFAMVVLLVKGAA